MTVISKILDEMYSNFIPTVVGVFIALWVANYATKSYNSIRPDRF
jgi:hypothetical protein